MEPQLPPPHSSPENPDFLSRPKGPEDGFPGVQERVQPSVERGEREESRERVTGAGSGDTASFQPPIAPPVPAAQSVTSSDPPATLGDDTPLTAADEDLIEMEWVNKAKKIVNETKTDPYIQEREVSKLQASYLQKRYDKEIKLPKEE